MAYDFVRPIPFWVSLLGTPHQTPHVVRLLFFDSSKRHRQHHAQRQPAPQLHFAHASYRMQFNPERDVQSAVDPFDGRPLIVFFSPFVAGAVNRGKDPPIRHSGMRIPCATGHCACPLHSMPYSLAGHTFFKVLRSFSTPHSPSPAACPSPDRSNTRCP